MNKLVLLHCFSYSLAIHCPMLPSIKAAIVIPSYCLTGPTRFQTTCEYVCAQGYVIDGEPLSYRRSLWFQLNGTWSAEVPNCRGKFLLFFFKSLPLKSPFEQ